MRLIGVSGIYVIQNKLNKKMYIGSSDNIQRRWNEHKKELRRNIHSNLHLQSSWNKYGEKNFEFTLLDTYDKEYIRDAELYWINMTGVLDSDVGYNKQLPNTYDSFAKSQLAIKNGRNKPISQYTLNGIHIKDYISLAEASKSMGMPKPYISGCIRGKVKSSLGFIWVLKGSSPNLELRKTNKNIKPVDCFTINGEYINSYVGLHAASKATKVGRKEIKNCCEGKMKHAGKLLWKYKTKICQE